MSADLLRSAEPACCQPGPHAVQPRAERSEPRSGCRLEAGVSQPFLVTRESRFLGYPALQPFAPFDYQSFGLITIKPSDISGKTVATMPKNTTCEAPGNIPWREPLLLEHSQTAE
jgi:hypothetical protein